MTEVIKEIKNKAPTQPKKVELITLTGITTSQINQALKADNPYPARVFLKIDNQEQDIPIFFRIRCDICAELNKLDLECDKKECQEGYIRPKIKTGSYLQVEGHFANPTTDKNQRKSFTATSYQLLNQEFSQEILVNHE